MTPAKRAVGAARLSRGRSHARGGHPKAGSCCDIRWGEREGGAHRRGLRTVCDRAEPGPPPEEEAKDFRCRYFPACRERELARPTLGPPLSQPGMQAEEVQAEEEEAEGEYEEHNQEEEEPESWHEEEGAHEEYDHSHHEPNAADY